MRPDFMIIDSDGEVFVIELTCPFESNTGNAHQRKYSKYTGLCDDDDGGGGGGEADDGETATIQTEALDTLSSPTGIGFGPSRLYYIRGSIVGNFVLDGGAALLLCGFMAMKRWSILQREETRQQAKKDIPTEEGGDDNDGTNKEPNHDSSSEERSRRNKKLRNRTHHLEVTTAAAAQQQRSRTIMTAARRQPAAAAGVPCVLSWQVAATAIGAPSVLHIPISILLQPTISSCFICFAQPESAGDIVLGIVGFLACIAYSCFAVWRCTCGILASARIRPQKLFSRWSSRFGGVLSPFWMSAIFGLFDTKTTWKDHQNSANRAARGFVRRNSVWLEPYRRGCQWFLMLDIAVNFASGIVGGLALSIDLVPCMNLKYAQTCFNILWLGCIVGVRPFREPFDQPVALLSALISVLWGAFTLARDEENVAEALTLTQMWLSLAVLFVVGCLAMVSPAMRLMVLGRPFLRHVAGAIRARLFPRSSSQPKSTSDAEEEERSASSMSDLDDDEITDRILRPQRPTKRFQPVVAVVEVVGDSSRTMPSIPTAPPSSFYETQYNLQVVVFAACLEARHRRRRSASPTQRPPRAGKLPLGVS